jgi:hypothetical protein
MAYAATLLVAVAIFLGSIYMVHRAITREVPADRESDIEVKFGPASIRRKVGSPPPSERNANEPTRTVPTQTTDPHEPGP